MIYLDASVALASILAEDERPPVELWEQRVVSSRLLQYEVWNRLHRKPEIEDRLGLAEGLLSRVSFLELSPRVLERALEPFPLPLRTLDALHLASLEFLIRQGGQSVQLASYDQQLLAAADSIGIFPWSQASG